MDENILELLRQFLMGGYGNQLMAGLQPQGGVSPNQFGNFMPPTPPKDGVTVTPTQNPNPAFLDQSGWRARPPMGSRVGQPYNPITLNPPEEDIQPPPPPTRGRGYAPPGDRWDYGVRNPNPPRTGQFQGPIPPGLPMPPQQSTFLNPIPYGYMRMPDGSLVRRGIQENIEPGLPDLNPNVPGQLYGDSLRNALLGGR